MKRMNFNIKDRKFLITTLSLVMVCVFTLSIAYAALNAVLTIQGNAEVVASTWNIYLDNPRVTVGSATTNVPEIKTSSRLEFATTLDMPGDFYEFTVDVVNGGSIDAMIANVVKTPELTVEQAKFLKYEITYQNGESITNKQLLKKNTIMPIKVRVEYRKDLNNNDLPTGQVVLDLALTLEYVQSDGTGSSVEHNGYIYPKVISGDIEISGSEICIDTECFYVISSDDTSVTMLSKYNLYVGGQSRDNQFFSYTTEATGIQNSTMLGYREGLTVYNGTTHFSDYGNSYENSLVQLYTNNYVNYLEGLGIDVQNSRMISVDELKKLGCIFEDSSCDLAPSWVYSTSYFIDYNYSWYIIYGVSQHDGNEIVSTHHQYGGIGFGVRPVIVISTDYFK